MPRSLPSYITLDERSSYSGSSSPINSIIYGSSYPISPMICNPCFPPNYLPDVYLPIRVLGPPYDHRPPAFFPRKANPCSESDLTRSTLLVPAMPSLFFFPLLLSPSRFPNLPSSSSPNLILSLSLYPFDFPLGNISPFIHPPFSRFSPPVLLVFPHFHNSTYHPHHPRPCIRATSDSVFVPSYLSFPPSLFPTSSHPPFSIFRHVPSIRSFGLITNRLPQPVACWSSTSTSRQDLVYALPWMTKTRTQ